MVKSKPETSKAQTAREQRGQVMLSLEVEPELRRRIKLRAAATDSTVKDVVLAALEEYLQRHEKKS